MAEDLSEHLADQGIKVNYLHSEIKTLDRIKILKDLRLGTHDVIVGVNLLREGLDLPEVSLIAILDADKEGFLRNYTTLIQTMGRAARNVNGHVIMYADKQTKSIKEAVQEATRRRKKQELYNIDNNITPATIIKEIGKFDLPISKAASYKMDNPDSNNNEDIIFYGSASKQRVLKQLEKMMERAMRKFEYETAMELKEQIRKLKGQE